MDTSFVIAQLSKEWSKPDGFFGRLREGHFEKNGVERVANLLRSIEIEDNVLLDRKLVSLIWYIPLFMSWQNERVAEEGGDVQELEKAINLLQNILEDILGIP